MPAKASINQNTLLITNEIFLQHLYKFTNDINYFYFTNKYSVLRLIQVVIEDLAVRAC